tara:strand:- start:4937 stop:6457 length:1521 start_codon:yes stop_codon:yes gene_type:complete
MAQETEIKVRIDDNEALQALREMASLVSQISDGLGGLKMSPDAVPHSQKPTHQAPSQSRTKDDDNEGVKELRGLYMKESKAFFTTLTSNQTMSSLTHRLGESLSNIGRSAPFGLGVFAAFAGAGFRALGRSLEARERRLGEIVNLEALETQMRGVLDAGSAQEAQALGERTTNQLQRFGFDSTQARQFILGLGNAIGFQTNGALKGDRLDRLASAERTGVSAQGIASLAGVLSQNTGDAVGEALDKSLSLRNIAERNLDLRGSGVDRFLSQFGGIVEGLTAQGLSARSLPRTLTNISGRLGRFGRGQRPIQVERSLRSVGQGAFNQIASPLQEIAQMTALAEIMSSSSNMLEAMQEAERMQQNPLAVVDVMASVFGTGRDGQAILGSIPGIGTRDSRLLLTGQSTSVVGGDRISASQAAESLTLSAAQADQSRQTVQSLRDDSKDRDTFQRMIEISGEMERSTLKMTENIQMLTDITNAQVALGNLTSSAVAAVSRVMDELRRLLP